MKHICIFFIKIYQKLISPLLPSKCRYVPSCSNYAIESIKKRGALAGIFMGGWRILRCNRFSMGGVDLVPDKIKGDLKWVL